MKLLLMGNYSCGNRGDAAILRGLLAGIDRVVPDADVTVTSRYPVSASFLLGRPVIPDPIANWPRDWRPRLPRRLQNRYRYRWMPTLLERGVAGRRGPSPLLPAPIRAIVADLAHYDLVVQVGGGNYVDLYGLKHFELPFAAMLAGRPVLLIGHSMGPFGDARYRRFAATLLERADGVLLREGVSLRLLREAGLPEAGVRAGTDTAWLVDPESPAPPGPDVAAMTGGRRAIAITLRDLAPFDKRLGIGQDAFEAAFARLCDGLAARGYDVVACSTCTGIESYHRDDRMPALRVRARVAHPDRFHVVMDELNDLQLGRLFGQCDLLVGTRLHSAIIAMNFGTPAVALNYEHKSEGILAQLGLPELAGSIPALVDGSLAVHLAALLDDLPALRTRVATAVAAERARARAMIETELARHVPPAAAT